jgi:signal transduction histidine kinase
VREVHDSVAHSLSVSVLQLGALRSTMPPETPQAELMIGVERLGRESVRELRGLVGILREGPEGVEPPQPSLTRAAELADEVRAAGLPVELRTEGDVAGLPRSLDTSAYRVVQEALTNVFDGALEACRRPDGGFAVRTRFPLGARL